MSSRVLLRTSSDVLRKSYLKGAVGTPQRTALDAGGPSMLIRSQFDPTVEMNYLDDPRLAVGESFTRATVRTVRDFESRTLTLKSGEVGFWGFRRIENLVATKSEDLTNAAWTKTGSSASAVNRLKEDASNGEHRATQVLVSPAGILAGQFEAARVVGSDRHVQIDMGDGGANTLTMKVNLTTGAVISSAGAGAVRLVQAEVERAGNRWRLKIAGYGFSANATFAARMLNAANAVSYQGDGQSEVEITKFQATSQNGMSFIGATEYVSVGVLSSPFHGAAVDGVKYFATDYAGAPIKRFTGDTIKYLQLCNVAASPTGYASTPDSAANSVTGNIILVACVAPQSWAQAYRLVSKRGAAGFISYSLLIGGGGGLSLETSADGTTTNSVASTVTTTFPSGATRWVMATREPSSGVVRFYWSADPPNTSPRSVRWTQLGADVTGATGIQFDSTAVVEIGTALTGTFQGLPGIVYRAQVYSGTNIATATLAADFNPNDASAAGAASFASSTTGETWTINSNNVSARINTYTKPGRRGLRVEVPTTNLQIRSDALSDATYTKTRSTVTADALVGLDGSSTADKLKEDATAASTHIVANTALVKAASALAYTLTYYLQAGERSAARLDVFNGANGVFARFNLLDGTVLTAATAFGAGWVAGTASIVQVSPGVYACMLPVTSDATAAIQTQIGLYNAADSYNGDNASGIYVHAQQLEQVDHATSYVPTAAAAVARNLDSTSLALGSWFNAAAGTVLASFFRETYVAATQNIASLSDNTANERMDLFANAGTAARLIVTDGGVAQVDVNGGVFAAAAKGAVGFAFALNDFALDDSSAVLATDVVGTLPTVTQLDIGHARGAAALDGWVSRLWLHDKRIPDSRIPGLLTTMVAA